MSKKYGLIVPDKKTKLTFQAAKNVFGEESDSDDENAKKPMLLKPSHNINRQAKITQEKAILDDPTVYQYDEIYDSMERKKKEEKVKSKEDKNPKYIENLLKTAQKRKIENERRVERQVQREREKEGDEFADKEVFVTSAYKKKLEEMRQEEEKEKYEEYLEKIGDVTKQNDLGGFYRHLYEQKLGPTKEQVPAKDLAREVTDAENNIDKITTRESSKGTKADKISKATKGSSDDQKKNRNYRKHKIPDVKLYEGEIEDSDEEINRFNLDDIRASKRTKTDENIDADSDFSIDDSSDDENMQKGEKANPVLKAEDTINEENTGKNKESINLKSSTPSVKKKEEKPKESKPKLDIWKKRTVGELFQQALKRYYERKSARGY